MTTDREALLALLRADDPELREALEQKVEDLIQAMIDRSIQRHEETRHDGD